MTGTNPLDEFDIADLIEYVLENAFDEVSERVQEALHP